MMVEVEANLSFICQSKCTLPLFSQFCVMCQEYVVVMYLHRNSIRSGVESGVECSETSDASEDACVYRRMRLETNAFPDACASRRISLHIPM
jgi:hypothetical protein